MIKRHNAAIGTSKGLCMDFHRVAHTSSAKPLTVTYSPVSAATMSDPTYTRTLPEKSFRISIVFHRIRMKFLPYARPHYFYNIFINNDN